MFHGKHWLYSENKNCPLDKKCLPSIIYDAKVTNDSDDSDKKIYFDLCETALIITMIFRYNYHTKSFRNEASKTTQNCLNILYNWKTVMKQVSLIGELSISYYKNNYKL